MIAVEVGRNPPDLVIGTIGSVAEVQQWKNRRTGCIEQAQCIGVVTNHDCDSIVVEDGRDIFGGEFVCRIADEETCLADGTVTDHHAPIGFQGSLVQSLPPL